MQKIKIATRDVSVPSGYVVTLKSSLSYGDNKRIYSQSIGSVITGVELKTTFSQAQEIITQTLVAYIADWDITEEDGSKTPLTKENIESVFTEGDVDFLMKAVKGDEEAKKKS